MAKRKRYHKILSLEVQGGFLSGYAAKFSPGLTCVIGGRGTGKTTVLEFLRYALKALPEHDGALRKRVERLVDGNLRAGVIRVGIETKDGLRYTVVRAFGEEPEILDADGLTTRLSLDRGVLFDADVFSQNEIEAIANEPAFQLELIDRFERKALSELETQIRSRRRELDASANDLVRLSREIAELSEGLAQLPALREKLKAYESQDPGADGLNQEVTLKGLRDKEQLTVQDVGAFLEDQLSAVGELGGGFTQRASSLIPAEVLAGPNAERFARLQAALDTAAQAVAAGVEAMTRELQAAKQSAVEEHAALDGSHRQQEQSYRDLIHKHEQEQGKARERFELQRALNRLEAQERERGEKERARKERRARRRELLRELWDLRDQRTSLRTQTAKSLSDRLTPDVRVNIEQFGDRSDYLELLSSALKGKGKQYKRLAESVARAIPPQQLARLVHQGDVDGLGDHLDVDTDRCRWLVSELQDTPAVYAIEVVELPDVPTVSLKDGDQYKDSLSLSTGQKCTAILPILLLESERPLLIDQPEDNLDNAFIYETVVKSIKKVVQKRQLLFVTHNPNIPVLGGAGRVLVMSSDGRHATQKAQGTVDEVRGHIETILEGGEEAFLERYRRYGH